MQVYVVASFFVYALVMVSVTDNTPSPCLYHASTWALGLIIEIAQVGLTLAFYTQPHREPKTGDRNGGKLETKTTIWEAIEIVIDLTRVLCLALMVGLYALFVYLRHSSPTRRHAGADTPITPVTPVTPVNESTRLLDAQGSPEDSTEHSTPDSTDTTVNGVVKATPNVLVYGTINEPHKEADEDAGWVRPVKLPAKNWWEYVSAYSLFIPYLWPAKNRRLQAAVIACFILMALASGVNLLVPIAAGRIINALAAEKKTRYLPFGEILVFICLKVLQGSSGILSALREYLWIPVSQYSYLELSVASFEHVHGLSLDFHLGKKTGEVLSALNKGSSINTFLGQVTFQFFPMLADLSIAIGFFFFEFDTYYALTVAVTSFAYMYITMRMAAWRSPIRREMTNLDREAEGVKYVPISFRVRLLLLTNIRNDSLTSYETVKYFGAEQYEFKRYRTSISNFQTAEYSNISSLNLMNVSQNIIFTIGLLITSFIAAYQVSRAQIPVGKFVVLLTYMQQLQGPLNFLGTFYRTIQQSMINSERLLELFKEKPTVIDTPRAEDLNFCHGEIAFKDVKFAYDPRRPALDGFNLTCSPGTTTALVGESGGGKSTVFRLLFRHYNIQSGAIEIDDHNVEDITIESLRSHIGVVPQDTVLFNESLMYNLKYANRGISDEEVYKACRAASIHDQILKFPDGYNTKVGERGLKLSGGEKQRIAIARTILKDPRIVLLDEATAALDTSTEQDIEKALRRLSDSRTTLIIAHRLSTIAHADQIAVLHAGKVAELGTHDELIALDRRYASMWRKQIRTQLAEKKAKVLTDRAEQIREDAATSDSANQSEDERSVTKRPPLELQMTAASRQQVEDWAGGALPPEIE